MGLVKDMNDLSCKASGLYICRPLGRFDSAPVGVWIKNMDQLYDGQQRCEAQDLREGRYTDRMVRVLVNISDYAKMDQVTQTYMKKRRTKNIIRITYNTTEQGNSSLSASEKAKSVAGQETVDESQTHLFECRRCVHETSRCDASLEIVDVIRGTRRKHSASTVQEENDKVTEGSQNISRTKNDANKFGPLWDLVFRYSRWINRKTENNPRQSGKWADVS